MSASPRRAFRSRTAPRRGSRHLRRYPPDLGAFAFDIGVWGYLYPGGTCYFGAPVDFAGKAVSAECATNFLLNGNVMKKTSASSRSTAKVNYTINDNWQFGLNEILFAEFPELRRLGQLFLDHRKYTAPSTVFGSSGVGLYISGEFGASGSEPPTASTERSPSRTASSMPTTTPGTLASASPTRCSRSICATPTLISTRVTATLFTSAFNASGTTNLTPINPTGAGSNWCGAAGIAKLSADLTAMTA